MKIPLSSHATDPRPPALMFARCPGTQSGFLALPTNHASHPCKYHFADDASAEAYRRELISEPPRPRVLVVTGSDKFAMVAMIRGLIRIHHAEFAPTMLIASNDAQLARCLAESRERGDAWRWLVRDDAASPAIDEHLESGHRMRLLIHAAAAKLSPAVAKVARVVRLG